MARQNRTPTIPGAAPSRPPRRRFRPFGGPAPLAAWLVGALLAAGCGAPGTSDDGRGDSGAASSSEATPADSDTPSAQDSPRTGEGQGAPDSGAQDTPGEGNADGATASEGGAESPPDGQTQTGAVPLERTDVDADRVIDPESTAVETAADELRARGQIGDDDVLTPAGENVLGDRVFSRARQQHQDIPVYAAEVVVTVEGDRIVRIRGHAAPRIELATTTPAQDYPTTVAAAAGLLNHDIATDDDDEGTLVIFPVGGGYRLAWMGVVVIDQGPEEAVFDAETAEVLHRVPVVLDAAPDRERRVHDFARACRDGGVRGLLDHPTAQYLLFVGSPLVRSETETVGHPPAERLFDLLGDFYAFLDVFLEMDSLDGRGLPLTGVIGVRFHEVSPWQQCFGDEFNAYWSGEADIMVLPNAALDFPEVIAHELTHGLIGHGSRLIYSRQPGALNEAISDAMGATFAGWIANGAVRNPDAVVRMTSRHWQMREPGGVMRDMSNPGSVRMGGTRLPDHYDDFEYMSADNGGVHVNSSIVNQGFYLLAEGGRHPRGRGPAVEGLGAMRAMRIFGLAATSVLTRNDDFEDARYAFADVAEALHGSGSPEWVATHTAMDAIGIPGEWELPRPDPPPPPPPAPRPPAPQPSPPPALPDPPAPEPDPPAPDPVSPDPTTPSPDPPAPDPALPPPAPQPVPPPDPPAPDPAPPDPATPTPDPAPPAGDAPASHQTLVLALIIGLAVLGVAGMLLTRRSGRRSPGGERGNDGPAERRWNVPNRNARPDPPPPPPLADIMGSLQPADGSTPILLPRALLSSREGLIIGRDKELCHVEIRDSAVSRRHVRLRVSGGTILAEDLNSLQGTEAEGVALKPFVPQPVAPGQTLGIAGHSYRIATTGVSPK